jgi:hypothetical protein
MASMQLEDRVHDGWMRTGDGPITRPNGLRHRRFRVEHVDRDERRVLGCVEGVFPHHTALAPYVARLLLDGAGGEVVLVDEATEVVAARRILRPTAPRRAQ